MTQGVGPTKRERGFSLVTAIFIIVVLAFLALMMVTIGGVQRATATAAAQGARAYHAARAGIEWGVHQALNNTVATCGATPSTSTTNTFTPPAADLQSFNVTVVCSYTAHRERGPPDFNIYVIHSTATFGAFGDADYVSRRINVTVTGAAP